MSEKQVALSVSHLDAGYAGTHGYQVIEDINFTLNAGETLGIVGESGCGKSTIAKAVMRLITPNSGTVNVNGIDFSALRGASLRRARSDIQMVFQDPFGSLDPRMTILEIVAQPLRVHQKISTEERLNYAQGALERLGISETLWQRKPGALSGGQRQRVAIARATVVSPAVTVLDEAVSALDVSVQAQVLNLLRTEQISQNLAYLFIVHDLSIAHYFCDQILVLYLGKVVEQGPANEVFSRPLHPYTAALVSASPEPGKPRRERILLHGEPQARRPATGCPFAARCPIGSTREKCRTQSPELKADSSGHAVACHFPGELQLSTNKTTRE